MIFDKKQTPCTDARDGESDALALRQGTMHAADEVVCDVVQAVGLVLHDPATASQVTFAGHSVVHARFDQSVEREVATLRLPLIEGVDLLERERCPAALYLAVAQDVGCRDFRLAFVEGLPEVLEFGREVSRHDCEVGGDYGVRGNRVAVVAHCESPFEEKNKYIITNKFVFVNT